MCADPVLVDLGAEGPGHSHAEETAGQGLGRGRPGGEHWDVQRSRTGPSHLRA